MRVPYKVIQYLHIGSIKMPRYRRKVTQLMEYQDFKRAIAKMNDRQRAFLTLLFLAGCRVSEALALRSSDIRCAGDTVYVQFHRLKGSKQTDPQELPRVDDMGWLCGQDGRLFPFSRSTAYRLVRRAFPELYPHYFRMNRITKTDILFGDAVVYHVFGICANSIDHYRAKIDTKMVAEAMKREVEMHQHSNDRRVKSMKKREKGNGLASGEMNDPFLFAPI